MARTRIKICGITNQADADAAVNAGADMLGFVFTKSPRRVTRDTIKGVIRNIPTGVQNIAVFKDEDIDFVHTCTDNLPIHAIQIDIEHYLETDLEGDDLSALPVVRTSSEFFADLLDPEPSEAVFEPCVVEGPRSGVGEKPDWSLVARAAANYKVILAGGLTPDNVAEAIRIVRPYAVDVSSGVESTPGKKDPAKIRDFIRAVRDVDRELF